MVSLTCAIGIATQDVAEFRPISGAVMTTSDTHLRAECTEFAPGNSIAPRVMFTVHNNRSAPTPAQRTHSGRINRV